MVIITVWEIDPSCLRAHRFEGFRGVGVRDPGFRVSRVRVRGQGARGLALGMLDLGFWVQDLGFRV